MTLHAALAISTSLLLSLVVTGIILTMFAPLP
jgi:hypothetical protein